MVVADGTHRRLVAAARAGHNVAAVEKDAGSGQLPAQEADVAVAEVLYLKLWHLEEKRAAEEQRALRGPVGGG